MAFITKSNFYRIHREIKLEDNINYFERLDYKKPIYFLNKKEIIYLNSFKELLKNSKYLISKYYAPIKNTDSFTYVFEGISPSYHLNTKCINLNSSFENYKIPDQIINQGKEKIIQYRKWFKQNSYLIDTPDIFEFRIQKKFKIKISINSVLHANSGIEQIDNLNLQELENKIDFYLSKAGQYFKNSSNEKKEIIRKFQKITFLAYTDYEIKNNETRFSDKNIKLFLKQYDTHFKKPVKELLKQYYKVKYNPELKFEGELLEQLGFKPCKACLKKLDESNS